MTHEPYSKNLSSKNIYYLLKASVSIIHNIARWPGHDTKFKGPEIKNALVNFIQINDSDFLGIICILLLAILVDETELSLLETGKSTIKTLLSKIKECMGRNPQRIDGFALWELMNGLKNLSSNDNMKKSIVKEDGLNVVLAVLKTPKNGEDLECSMATIWNLCFDKDIRSVLNTVYSLRSVVKLYESHENSKVKRSYEGIMWLLDQKQQSVERVKTARGSRSEAAAAPKWKFDIFFSYCWANKSTVLSIRDDLVSAGLRVWLDVDQMKGSTLEAMADGIENSLLFVMAVSEAYRTSPACRTEAEYAFSLKKVMVPLVLELRYKPTGWLGFLMGSKTYFEFSERRTHTESMRGLLETVRAHKAPRRQSTSVTGATAAGGDTSVSVESGINRETVVPLAAQAVGHKNANVRQWSRQQAEKWLSDAKMGHLRQKLAVLMMEPELLLALASLSRTAPDCFMVNMKTEYGMKLVDLLRLQLALEKLY